MTAHASEAERGQRKRRTKPKKSGNLRGCWNYFFERRAWSAYGKASKRTALESDKPIKDPWQYMSRRHRLLYLCYIVPMLLTLTLTAMVMYIPWFLKCCRPSRYEHEGKKILEKYDARQKQRPRDVWVPVGYGEERFGGFWRGWYWRSWEIYCLMRECWHTLHRQGLQVLGVLCGIIIGSYQIQLVVHDLTTGPFQQYLDAVTSGGDSDLFKTDSTCAYTVGTGLPNWGGPYENLAWYLAYHGWILLLCLMLIGEELFNVRLGLFAPVWNRAGTGYTIMFLAVATLSGSPNWGWKALIRVRYVLLVAIFSIGLYNVLRHLISSCGCADDGNFNAESSRNARYPLQPWSEANWEKRGVTPSFMMFSADATRRVEKLFWTERWQCKIGDHAWPLTKMARTKTGQEMKRVDNLPMKLLRVGEDVEEEKVVLEKSATQKRRERGHISRKVIHGFPIDPPPLEQDQKFMRQRYYIARLYLLDRFKWSKRTGLVEPTDEEIESKKPGPGFRWETKEEFSKRAANDTNRGAGFYGLANWEPRVYDDQRSLHVWFYIFDIRRIVVVVMATAMILVHIQLMVYNLGYGYSSWPAYRARYDKAATSWKNNNGPSEGDCQFYQGSSLSIWIKLGDGSIQGVLATIIWYCLWEVFIISMCLGVILVGLSNNRTWGMHLPWCITLIGPRLSSISLGWTIGFIGVATMQLGFFNFSDAQMWIARLTGYGCLASWASFVLLRNEAMRNLYIRRPLLTKLSTAMMYYMDDKKYRRSLADFDDD